ncbi:unnamed protein product, partial [Tilletia laevis]
IVQISSSSERVQDQTVLKISSPRQISTIARLMNPDAPAPALAQGAAAPAQAAAAPAQAAVAPAQAAAAPAQAAAAPAQAAAAPARAAGAPAQQDAQVNAAQDQQDPQDRQAPANQAQAAGPAA